MKRISWKYLAGLIDGEGCIDLSVQKLKHCFYFRPRLRICMAASARPLLDILHTNYGGHFYFRKKSVNPNWQDALSWELVGYERANSVLRNTVNHLILKKEQARLCLWLNEHIKGTHVGQKTLTALREELALMKRDPHRLSETAQTRVWDAIVENTEIPLGINMLGDGRDTGRVQKEHRSCVAGQEAER